MSGLRKYIASVKLSADYDHIRTSWDIPLDERVTADEANVWLSAQLDDAFHQKMVCVVEGLDNEEWDAAVDFVWECLRHGVMPHEYVNLLIKRQQMCDDFYSPQERD